LNKFGPLVRHAGFAIVIMTIAVAAVGFFVVRRDVDDMRDAGRENILWDAAQIEIELMRFQGELARFSGHHPDASVSAVNNRFDLLWSRVLLFCQGAVGERLRGYDTNGAILSELFALIQNVEPKVVGLSAGDATTALALQNKFSPFTIKLRLLSQEVLHGEEANHAALRENLSQSSNLLTIISVVAVLSSLLLILVFSRETRQFRALARQNETLLVASNAAGRAKSQFLAMMSHELRTPMNGVLGLLALIRQQGLGHHQARLLGQAERSGRQMIGLLADILDFSALQDDRLELECKPFDPTLLASAVRDMFAPVALREGIEFSASTDTSCPDRVLGDFARLRQALTHLATYLLETAGTENIALEIKYSDDHLNAEMSFEYSRAGGEWDPQLIVGRPADDIDSFATEALGPAVSRGLISKMGGTTRLYSPDKDRIAVQVAVPAKAVSVDILLVKTACQSAALEAICKAALRCEKVKFLTQNSPLTPHVVMVESGGILEYEQVQSCSERYPEALLVALGRPQNPDKFDDIVDVPIDIVAIRQSDFMHLSIAKGSVAAERKLG